MEVAPKYSISPKFIVKLNYRLAILVPHFFVSECRIYRFIIKNVKKRKKYEANQRNSVFIRILVRYIGSAICYFRIKSSYSQSVTSKISKYQQYHPASIVSISMLVSHIGTAIYYLFIYFQFRFLFSIFKNPQLSSTKYQVHQK